MQALRIGELAQQVGVRTSAIRYYESIGLLPTPARVNGWRCYDSAAVERLQVIKAAREMGFRVGEISLLLDDSSCQLDPNVRWRKLAEQKLPEIDSFIERAMALRNLILAGLDCDCEDIALCLTTKGKSCESNGQSVVLDLGVDSCECADCD